GHLMLTSKTYEATIRLGQATLTDDADGEVVSAAGAGLVGPVDVAGAMAALRGTITQVPSTVSAIKVDGQRAYARVRRGEDVVLAGRTVTVSRFDALDFRRLEVDGVPVLDLDVVVDCSSGTYIRALARDLGSALGTGGHLTRLRRTRVGGFSLADPHLDPAALEQAPGSAVPLLGLAEVARRSFPAVDLDDAAAADVRHGRALGFAVPGPVAAVLGGGELLALYRPEADRSVAVAVLVGG
ncbi:MAG: tRNA pseudouridine(55) synthase TruB, partial [Propionicimonas sp.]